MFGVGEHIPKIREIDVAKITPNPDQPRKLFNPAGLDELAASIKAKGLLQPILVKAASGDGAFVIVAGERRFRAMLQIAWTTVPAIVTEGDTEEIALIENMQREGLLPLEEAEAIDRLMRTHGYTLEEAGRVLGKSKSSMSELVSILKLPEDIRAEVRISELRPSKSMLIELAKIEPEAQRTQWEAFKSGCAGFSALRSARQAQKTERAGQAGSRLSSTIKDAVKCLYAFAKRAGEHQKHVSKDDLKILLEAKTQADHAYRLLISKEHPGQALGTLSSDRPTNDG